MILNIPITEIQTSPQQFAVHTTWNTHKSILQSFQPNIHLQFNVPNNRSNQPGTKQPIGIIVLSSFFLFPLRNQSVRFYLYIYFAFYSYTFFPAVYLLSVYRKCWVLRKITKARLLIQKKTWIETTSFERNEVYPCVNNVSNEFSITRNGIQRQIGSVWVILKQIYHKNPVCFSLSNLQLSKGILKFCSFPRCLNLHCLPLFHSCITNHLQ